MEKENLTQKQIKILKVAKYIIQYKATIQMAADEFKCSISSIKKYINDENNLKKIDEKLYNEVKRVQNEIISMGNKKGGQIGKRTATYTEEEAEKIAKKMIALQMTLSQGSSYFDIPVSTLYELLKRINNPEIRLQLEQLFLLNSMYKTEALNNKNRLSIR